MTLFERTKKVAAKRGMSLQEVAKKSGLGINSIYRWKERNPTTTNLEKVANTLNVSVAFLLGQTDSSINRKPYNLTFDYEGDEYEWNATYDADESWIRIRKIDKNNPDKYLEVQDTTLSELKYRAYDNPFYAKVLDQFNNYSIYPERMNQMKTSEEQYKSSEQSKNEKNLPVDLEKVLDKLGPTLRFEGKELTDDQKIKLYEMAKLMFGE